MKKQNKPKQRVIKDLASHFEADFNASLPISIQPNGSIVYKDFLIKKNKFENWAIYHIKTGDFIDQFYLKTCALMAARAYYKTEIEKFKSIKSLDNRYWANYTDSAVYKRNIKTTTEYERYLILLNKLEYSEARATHFRDEISKMFKWSFV